MKFAWVGGAQEALDALRSGIHMVGIGSVGMDGYECEPELYIPVQHAKLAQWLVEHTAYPTATPESFFFHSCAGLEGYDDCPSTLPEPRPVVLGAQNGAVVEVLRELFPRVEVVPFGQRSVRTTVAVYVVGEPDFTLDRII